MSPWEGKGKASLLLVVIIPFVALRMEPGASHVLGRGCTLTIAQTSLFCILEKDLPKLHRLALNSF